MSRRYVVRPHDDDGIAQTPIMTTDDLDDARRIAQRDSIGQRGTVDVVDPKADHLVASYRDGEDNMRCLIEALMGDV